MNRLRNRLLLAFLLAALGPLVVSLWLTSALLERSLSLNSTREVDSLSKALRATGRELYQQACENLRAAVEAGRIRPELRSTILLLCSVVTRPVRPTFFRKSRRVSYRSASKD